MGCACKQINANFGGCIGEHASCQSPCVAVQAMARGRGESVPTCWGKSRPAAGEPAR